jgi:2-polyprenyl-6-methoxyphenol hydroxylase-like FAD-dependent oxidoreductase
MTQPVGERAIVLGGSMAGLLAARVLADSFTEVVIVDRDRLRGEAGPRRGVPQGRHAHALLARGQQNFEALFPGLTNDIAASGVPLGDLGDLRWYFHGQRLHPTHTGLVCLSVTRPVLEWHVRERVAAIPNVVFLEECDILDLVTTPDRRRVTGARIQRQSGGQPEALDADVVIDTTGRGSRTPAWLESLGYQRAPEDRVKIDLAYTTRHFRLPSDLLGDDLGIMPVATPSHPRGAIFARLGPEPGGGDRYLLSLIGILGDHPPTDPEGFLGFVKSLPIPDIYQAVQDAEPVDDITTMRYPASVWRRYDRLDRFPEGLLPMGDGVCSFNPIYAQGMTIASQEALALREHLRQGAVPSPLRLFRDMAKIIKGAWEVAGTADLAYPAVEGHRSAKVRVINAYLRRLHHAAVRDGALTDAFLRVAGLMDPPESLLRPDRVVRVLRGGMRPDADPPTPDERSPHGAVRTSP